MGRHTLHYFSSLQLKISWFEPKLTNSLKMAKNYELFNY